MTHVLPIQLRFRDTDRFGHVNNAVYATYAELARVDFLFGLEPAPEGLILASLKIDFRRQLHLGQEVEMRTRVARIGTTSVGLRQDLYADGQLAAEIQSVVVVYDYARETPVPVPEGVRAVLERYVVDA